MIQINYRDNRPLYEQIREQLRRLITTGVLNADEKLPSVRELASQLAINPNTIQRAYRELETDGYIYKISGRGTFVSEISEKNSLRKNELMAKLDDIVTELICLSVTEKELTSHIHNLAEQKGGAQ